MPTAGVGGNRSEHPAHIGVENEPSGEVCGVLRLHGIGHVVTLNQAVLVVEQSGGVGAPLKISEPQRVAAPQKERPACTTMNGVFPQRHLDEVLLRCFRRKSVKS